MVSCVSKKGYKELERHTGVLYVEPIARSKRDDNVDASSSVGNARASEMEKIRIVASRYMMNLFGFGCEK